MIYFDTETCGFHGPIVLLQWSENDGDVNLYNPWENTIDDTIELIEYITNYKDGICGFNLSFDWFHICQIYSTLLMFNDSRIYPIDVIDDYAIKEEKARFIAPCLKPHKPIDIMLHARKGKYQSTMDRSPIVIRKVPIKLAHKLANKLDKEIVLNDIHFAKKKDVKKRWQVMDIKSSFNDTIDEFKNVSLQFAPSSALKSLAKEILNVDPDNIKLFVDVELPSTLQPIEYGYAPYAMAVGTPEKWNGAYPDKIKYHIEHWEHNTYARQYATDDVIYTRDLYKYFNRPESDYDSELACMVGAIRWRGFSLNKSAIQNLKNNSQKRYIELTGLNKDGQHLIFNPNAPESCKYYLYQVLNETEKIFINGSTKATILEEISKWKEEEVCDCSGLDDQCVKCDGTGLISNNIPHKASIRASNILEARHMKKEVELYDKLLLSERWHPSFNIIGTKSSRMSGRDGLNPQGIKSSKEVRECFTLKDKDEYLSGGDFDAFEISLADAVYGDPILREELLSGKKIHALFGEQVFAPMTYDEIIESKQYSGDKDKYTRSKNGVFALLYGGQAYTLVTRVGISEDRANEAYDRWCSKYKIWAKERQKIFDMFCSMRQPKGIGTRVIWNEPADYVGSMFGFKRYFTLENLITKTLFNLAENPPKDWLDEKDIVTRRDRDQSTIGATRSALFACAFQIQAANMRAAGNHVIQSSGAQLTKLLQFELWKLQPYGIHGWKVRPINMHDEVKCVTNSEDFQSQVHETVKNFIIKYKEKVPLLSMDWKTNLQNWWG